MLPGKKIKMYYDPHGNLIRTVNPDKSEQWVINGKPNTLDSVAVKNSWSFKNYAPTPWESYTYDSDDLAPRTNGTSYGHDFTPKSATVDALGRTVKTIDRLSQNASDDVVMKYQYDIRGNLLKVTDALNRPAFAYTYDLRPQPQKEEGEEEKKLPPISTWHIDSGAKQNISDVTGKAIELRDAKGAQVLSGYDTISRPINIWEKDKTGEATTLRQHLIYGDSAGLPTPKDNNYLGKLYQQYDEAGLQQINNYDFKGNITDKFRKVISDATLLSVFGGSTVDCYRVNWQGLNTSILDAHEHQTNSAYDALNRVTELIYPEDVSAPTAKRKVLLPAYNNAGALESVVLKDDIGGTPTTYVNHIANNAKGQRILIAFGNGVMTRYAYDKNTFRLKRQRTETYMQTGWTFASGGNVKQDTAYTYDLIGNILATNEAVTGCGIGGSNNLLRHFVYDDLYRLLSATGRENAPLAVPIWDDSFRSTDNSSTTAYTQRYQYDKMGNIKQLKHEGANNFTRNFNYNIATNNQLQSVDIGMTNYAFSYDANGNQLTETANRKMEWDAADRMRSFYVEASGSITKYTQYLYDGSGNRVKKLTWVQSGDYDSNTYIDGIFEYRTDGTDEQNTLHVMDDKSRIATVRIGADFGDTTPAIKYNIEDHLGSSAIQLETNGANINKEEYYPFGETSFGSYAKKRYTYCGKERDDESGLYYYGARYYNAWCCRFVNVDPLRDKYTFYTPYQYAGNKPINFIDLDGLEEANPKGEKNGGENKGDSENKDYSNKSVDKINQARTERGEAHSPTTNRHLSIQQKAWFKKVGAHTSQKTGWTFKDNYSGKNSIKPESLPPHPKDTVIVETMKVQLLELPTANTGNVEIQKVAPVTLPVASITTKPVTNSIKNQIPENNVLASNNSRTGSDLGSMTEGYELKNIKTFYNKIIAIIKDNPTATVSLTINVYGGGKSEQQASENRFYNNREGKSSNELESIKNVFSQTRNYFNNAQVGNRINYNFVITNNPQLSTGRAVFNR